MGGWGASEEICDDNGQFVCRGSGCWTNLMMGSYERSTDISDDCLAHSFQLFRGMCPPAALAEAPFLFHDLVRRPLWVL